MAIAPGDRLGVYEVRELIGAGGMGEVYRASDTTLNRSVALKILPEAFARDADRLARFKREAQVLASLNHSNIGSIFGFEEANGFYALVLELIEGPTLADRIAGGPLPLDEALTVARQIADALEAAHAQTIIHRDLKPANIKVRADGTVKVLDFGLAKALADERTTGHVTQSPTMTSPALTQAGIILGTAAYMSPEQARGRPADKRSDIWAFGAVLYEMLTGRRAFDGDDMSYTLANILKSDPDWSVLPAETPPALRRVLRRCLEKDPKRRTHDIADVRLDLDEKEENEDRVAAPPPPAKPQLMRAERIAWVLLAATLGGLLAYAMRREAPVAPVVRFQIHAPERGFFGSSSGVGRADGTSGGTISPDGTQLVFVGTDQAERSQLWLRRLDSLEARPLAGTDNGFMPFWSPDSRSVGFFADGRLKRLDVADGAVQTVVAAAGLPRGGTWGSRDVIVFSAGFPSVLARVSARGGDVMPLATASGEFGRWPSFLPDGQHFLYLGSDPSAKTVSVLVGSTEPGFTARSIMANDGNAIYSPPGQLVFVRGERLLQQPFDAERFALSGEATPLVEQVAFNAVIGRADFSISANGVLSYRTTSNRQNQFAWVDRAGKLLETVGDPGSYRGPDLSPDGQKLVYHDVARRDIWILDLARKTTSRLTSGPGNEASPVWFPDGSKVAYRIDQDGMYVKDVGGTGVERLLLKQLINGPDQVSADGKWIVYFAITPNGNQDVYMLPTTGDAKPQLVVQTQFADVEPQLSPDGRWLAYASNENGRNEIYVQAFPSTGQRWQVSTQGGRQPLWRRDGKELYFVADDRKFYAAAIPGSATSPADFAVPTFLFDMRANVFNTRNSYIPAPDGQRFLINLLLDGDDVPINVVQNWNAGLRD